ncbi:unnamed protein product [Effrenium voratum]|uniref:Peptidase A1 domain-containing protein n=1 Tax=Effrenium voratum TaxID=2562239 RepID=A0AA36JA36_9DINO|nr:unnamed protein product [Effrenium voratum]
MAAWLKVSCACLGLILSVRADESLFGECETLDADCALVALQNSARKLQTAQDPSVKIRLKKLPRLKSRREPRDVATSGMTGAAWSDFAVEVKIGTQSFPVVVDTGSSTFAVPDRPLSSCSEYYTGGCQGRHLQARYGSANWSGYVCQGPEVRVAGLSAGYPMFAGIYEQSNFLTECSSIPGGFVSSGIIGMAYPALLPRGLQRSLWDDVVATSGVRNIFAMQCCPWDGLSAGSGSLTLGGYDQQTYSEEDLAHTPITMERWFCVHVQTIFLDGFETSLGAGPGPELPEAGRAVAERRMRRRLAVLVVGALLASPFPSLGFPGARSEVEKVLPGGSDQGEPGVMPMRGKTFVALGGARVEALWEEDLKWYPATIAKDFGNGTFQVRWDDPDGWPDLSNCEEEDLRRIRLSYKPGDLVMAFFEDTYEWYNATVLQDLGRDRFEVRWDDPDGGPEVSRLCAEELRLVEIEDDYAAGDSVEALYSDDLTWYSGVVQDSRNGAYVVRWDDPDGGPKFSLCRPRYMKHLRPFADYQVGDRVDARCPSGEIVTGVVGEVNEDGTFQVQREGTCQGLRFRSEDLKGIFRDYSVGARVEALYSWEWHTGVVRRKLEFGAFLIRWDYPARTGPRMSMCTPEEMSLLEEEDDMEDWFEETDIEREPSAGASLPRPACPRAEIEARCTSLDLEVKPRAESQPPEVQSLRIHSPQLAARGAQWQVPTRPHLTLSPRQRGHRRNWRAGHMSRLLGSTVKRTVPGRRLVHGAEKRFMLGAAWPGPERMNMLGWKHGEAEDAAESGLSGPEKSNLKDLRKATAWDRMESVCDTESLTCRCEAGKCNHLGKCRESPSLLASGNRTVNESRPFSPSVHPDRKQEWNIGDWFKNIFSRRRSLSSRCSGIVDSGTSSIVMPKDVHEQVLDALNQVASARRLRSSCLSELELEYFPDMIVRLDSVSDETIELRIPAKQYFQLDPGATCRSLYLRSSHTLNSGLGEIPGFILGQPLLETYYTVFDKEKKRIGFAPLKGC